MIELIFVIVIIGILAAIAIPKLSATRDDAKVANEVNNAVQALHNLGAEYTAQRDFINYTEGDANAEVKCFSYQTAVDGNVTVSIKNPYSDCPNIVNAAVKRRASQNGLLSTNGNVKVHEFGGSRMKY